MLLFLGTNFWNAIELYNRCTLEQNFFIEHKYMRKFLPIVFMLCFLKPVSSKAQFEAFKDSVVQLYGIVMTADSLKGLEGVSIVVKNQNRGTISNDKGIFSIVVLKGDEIEFTSIGFKAKTIAIPKNLDGNQQSVIQLMVNDTIYLPATIILSLIHI